MLYIETCTYSPNFQCFGLDHLCRIKLNINCYYIYESQRFVQLAVFYPYHVVLDATVLCRYGYSKPCVLSLMIELEHRTIGHLASTNSLPKGVCLGDPSLIFAELGKSRQLRRR